MRLSWAHAAAGALTAVVAAGLLAMPSRLLGPDQAQLTPISLPRAASTTVVVAARPVARPRAKAVRRAARAGLDSPARERGRPSHGAYPHGPRHSQGRRPPLGPARRGRSRDDPEPRAAPPAAGRRAEGRPQARPQADAGSRSRTRTRTCSGARARPRAGTGSRPTGGGTPRRAGTGTGPRRPRRRPDLADARLRLHPEHRHARRPRLLSQNCPRDDRHGNGTTRTTATATATTTETAPATATTATSTGTAPATAGNRHRPPRP